MKSFFFAAALLLLSQADAKCADLCSGNGLCTTDDTCECYPNFQGVSCSERTCPFTHAYADSSHGYEECGGKGLCDRNSGICECFEGFTGKGCSRMKCPSDCSGNGLCRTIGGSEWDADKTQRCTCDPGYEGVACADRICPVGVDPMATGAETNEVIRLAISDEGDGSLSGELVLKFTDYRGEVWKTWPLDVSEISVVSIREALEGLPNQAIPSVTVTAVTETATSATYDIEFSDPANSGHPSSIKLSIDGSARTSAGSQPISAGSAEGRAITVQTAATVSPQTCSGRGTCDSLSGVCGCTDGFYGNACELQTTVM